MLKTNTFKNINLVLTNKNALNRLCFEIGYLAEQQEGVLLTLNARVCDYSCQLEACYILDQKFKPSNHFFLFYLPWLA
jgi:hypothetical protein